MVKEIIHVTDICHFSCGTCCLHRIYKVVGKYFKGTRETKWKYLNCREHEVSF